MDPEGTTQATPATGGDDSVEFWKAEAKKAFEARDAAKQRLRDAEGRLIPDERVKRLEELEAKEAQAEEEKKRAAGAFDALKTELVSKHQRDIAERDERLRALESEITEGELERAFYGANDLFGDNGATILTADMALPIFRKFVDVHVEDGRRRVVVKNAAGAVIHGSDGNPAQFAKALREVIDALPTRDRILRGSGKTGSGSSGGSDLTQATTLDATIAKAQQGDVDAVKALRKHQASQGGITYGQRRRAS